MYEIRKSFLSAINSTKEIMVLYDYFEQNHFDAVDYSDLLRWVWVQSLSILDKLIHELVLFYVTDIFVNNKPIVNGFKNFAFTALQCRDLLYLDEIEREKAIRNIISNKNSYESFQEPDKICCALSYFWPENHKLQKIAGKMMKDQEYVRTKLKNIVARRNQIAHQCDMLANNFEKQNITKQEALDVVNFIENFGITICDCIEESC